jgi:8-oxo-dGTP diphosphatase
MRPFGCNAFVFENNKVLLIKRGEEPFKGKWSLPGGMIEMNEDAEQCIIREVFEETGLNVVPECLIRLYSNPDRDPRKVIVALYHCKLISGELNRGSDASEAHWFSLDDLPELAGDRKKMINDAVKFLMYLNPIYGVFD